MSLSLFASLFVVVTSHFDKSIKLIFQGCLKEIQTDEL